MAVPPSAIPEHPLRPRRNPRWIAAGVLAMCLGAVGSLLLYTQAATANTVVAMSSTVMRGETVQADDLTPITVGHLAGIAAIPSSRLGDLVGKQALVDLAQGSIVVEGTVGRSEHPSGHSQVGLRLALGRLPIAALPRGTPIRIIAVTTQGSADKASAVSVRGTVATAPVETADGARVLDVWVPEANAETVARLAALDQIAIILEES
jgi:hypothetical protein